MPAPRWEPTAEEVAVILSSASVSEAAQRVGRNWATVHRWLRETGYRLPAQRGAPEPTDPPTDAPPAAEVAELLPDLLERHGGDLWTALESLQTIVWRLDPEREQARVHIGDDQPILVVFLTDLHIGHIYCDMQRLRHDFEILRTTPGIHPIYGGDLMDNVLGVHHTGMNLEELAPAHWQEYLVRWITARTRNRALAVIEGNHEEWSSKLSGASPMMRLAERLGAPYFGAFGMLHLELGTGEKRQTYRLLCGHQFRMNSSFNRTHAAKRLMDFIGDADVVLLGHKHAPAAEDTDVRGAERLFLQAGTYLRRTRYGRRLGFASNDNPYMPGVILFPDQHKMMGFKDGFGDGLHVLASYRSDLVCRCAHCAARRGEKVR